MLAMIGLFGALFAGVMVESVSAAGRTAEDEPEIDETGEDDGVTVIAIPGDDDADPSDLAEVPEKEALDPGPDPAVDPVSDDLPEANDDPVRLIGDAGRDLLSGEGADDWLRGGGGEDQLDGRAGDDRLSGGDGDDLAHGAAGADALLGGTGDDTLLGEDGDDVMAGGAGADSLCGGEGADTLSGGAGADTLLGGAGDDVMAGQAGDDWLAGGDGDDRLAGGTGADTLDGNAGDDSLSGMDDVFPDFLNGGEGDDELFLGAGDYGHGGDGADSFTLQDWLAQGDGAPATISDFSAAEDQIFVVYDAASHAAPELSLQDDAATGNVTLLLDGAPVAVVVGGGVDLADIRLMAA